MEIVIFVAFLTIQAVAKNAPVMVAKIAHVAIIQRISKFHWVVWIGHPVVLHSLHEYAIHFVVYSGFVISH